MGRKGVKKPYNPWHFESGRVHYVPERPPQSMKRSHSVPSASGKKSIDRTGSSGTLSLVGAECSQTAASLAEMRTTHAMSEQKRQYALHSSVLGERYSPSVNKQRK